MIKKILLWTAAVVAVAIVTLVVVVAMQPDDFHIERSAVMAAPPEEVFAQINDFHFWDAWSPWLEEDPQAEGKFEGPTSGEGAIFRWSGNDNVGAGSMTIVESKPSELVRIKIEFVRPFQDAADIEFSLVPQGDQTQVTWSMSGKNDDFFSKAVCLVMDMDQMIGDKYDQGLANLKRIVEAAGEPAEVAKGRDDSAAKADEPAGD